MNTIETPFSFPISNPNAGVASSSNHHQQHHFPISNSNAGVASSNHHHQQHHSSVSSTTFETNNNNTVTNIPHQILFNPLTSGGVRGGEVMENSGVTVAMKQGCGKRKIPIEKIDDKIKRHVTFSKRRKGLFSKASELCILCNSQVAIVTFSGAGKVFTFGHPSADSVIRRYLYGEMGVEAQYPATTDIASSSAANKESSISEVTVAYTGNRETNWPPERVEMSMPFDCYPVVNGDENWYYGGREEISPQRVEVESAEDGNRIGRRMGQQSGAEFWWEEEEVEDRLELEELQEYLSALEKVRNNVMLKLVDDDNDLPPKKIPRTAGQFSPALVGISHHDSVSSLNNCNGKEKSSTTGTDAGVVFNAIPVQRYDYPVAIADHGSYPYPAVMKNVFLGAWEYPSGCWYSNA